MLGLAFLASCGLPVNENPEFDSPAEADLDPGELVIGIEMDGEARAYPITAMAPLEILNDTMRGVPIAITWCPLSASSAIFNREVDGQALTLRFHPDLYKFNLIVEDLETHTQWSQLAKGSIEGELDGTELELINSYQVTWEYWYEQHPNTVVMRPRWGGHPFAYRDPGEPEADGLAPKSLVHMVWVDGEGKGYPLEELASLGGPLTDEVGGRIVTVRHVADGPTAAATFEDGTPVPGITLYREYLPEFYPNARLWRVGAEETQAGPDGGGP